MDDVISRQQAIDALCNDYCGGHQDCKYYPNCENLKSIEQLPSAQPDVATDINVGDTISRQQAIDAVVSAMIDGADAELVEGIMELLPSAQPERDIPVKPIETTDKAWGIPARQAVCPKCDYYLGHVVFLGDYKGKRVTYCETCGQAIDWEGWNFDE